LKAITLRCLEYESANRYPSAQALADDLQRFLKLQPLQTAINPSANERLDNWTRRNWRFLGLAAGAVVAVWLLALPMFFPVERRKEFLAAQTALDDESPRQPSGCSNH